MRLNLGSGPQDLNDHDHDGWVRVDIEPATEPDQVVDLRSFPWPWDDGEIDEVWCAHYVEHQTGDEWIRFVDELYRVLAPGAKATIVHPNLKSYRAFADPTHRDFIPAERWLYANREWRTNANMDRPPYPSCNFGIANLVYGNFEPGLEHRSDDAKLYALTGRWDAAADIMVELIKKD